MKDKQGHGSNARGSNSVDATYSSRFGVGGLGKGIYARTHSGEQYKLNPAATNGMIPRVGSEIDPSQHTRVIAAQHGIPTDHLENRMATHGANVLNKVSGMGKSISARPAGDTNPFPTRTAPTPFGRRK